MELRPYQKEALDAILEYEANGIHRQLIVLPTGCHRAGQKILMYDGTLKRVEDIVPEELLMGPDSKPRTVLQLCRGRGKMVKIIPVKGHPWVVNEDHILTLIQTNTDALSKFPSENTGGNLINVSVKEWLSWSKWKKHIHKLYRIGVEFSQENNLQIDPYFLGVLLGDGSIKHGINVTTNDPEIVEECKRQAVKYNLTLRVDDLDRCPIYHFSRKKGSNQHNPLMVFLGELDLTNKDASNKFIPQKYKLASYQSRLNLLAGLIDTDGSLSVKGYDFISKSQRLSEDVTFLARSLGLAAYISPCEKSSQNGATGLYWRVSISGHVNIIPCKILRKKAEERLQKKDVLRTGFSVEELGIEDYYGFTLSGDQLYLLDDFTVTHNTGKTVIFSHIPIIRPDSIPMLVLAHREELLNQAKEKIEHANPTLRVAIEQGSKFAGRPDVVVASVATLGRADAKRLESFGRSYFKVVVVDEAHHAAAPTYRRVLDYFDSALHLGVTATPQRGDNTRLTDVFDEIVYFKTIKEMMEDGWLTNLVGYRITTNTDISSVRIRAGEFSEAELSEAINTSLRNEAVLKAYNEIVPDLRTLVFCADVSHATDMLRLFQKNGIESACVLGTTESDTRQKILDQFRQGNVKVVINCMVLTEGFDEPLIEAIIMARPIQSQLLYTQIVGRGTRTASGKHHCVVIDIADISRSKIPLGLPTLMGLPPEFDLGGSDLLEAALKYDELEAKSASAASMALSLKDIDSAWEKIDLFTPPPPDPALLEFSTLIWREIFPGKYVLGLGKGESAILSTDALGRFTTKLHDSKKVEFLFYSDDLRDAFSKTDAWIQANRADRLVLLDLGASWRSDPPTEKQIKWLKKNGIPYEQLSKGEASQILDKLFSEKPKNPKPAWLQRKIDSRKF